MLQEIPNSDLLLRFEMTIAMLETPVIAKTNLTVSPTKLYDFCAARSRNLQIL